MSETGGSDGENTSAQAEPDGGWVGYPADQHGLPIADRNEQLTPDQRTALEQAASERAERHGRHQATVVVDVYESGEAVPMVEFPPESSLDLLDLEQVKQAVGRAAEALAGWS